MAEVAYTEVGAAGIWGAYPVYREGDDDLRMIGAKGPFPFLVLRKSESEEPTYNIEARLADRVADVHPTPCPEGDDGSDSAMMEDRIYVIEGRNQVMVKGTSKPKERVLLTIFEAGSRLLQETGYNWTVGKMVWGKTGNGANAEKRFEISVEPETITLDIEGEETSVPLLHFVAACARLAAVEHKRVFGRQRTTGYRAAPAVTP